MFIKGKDNSWARLGEEERAEFEKEALSFKVIRKSILLGWYEGRS